MTKNPTRIGDFSLEVTTDDRGRIVAEVYHNASGKTLAITEIDAVADAKPWAKKAIELYAQSEEGLR